MKKTATTLLILTAFYTLMFAYANREEIKLFFWKPQKNYTVVNTKKGGTKK